MKNSFYLIMMLAVFIAAPVLAETLILEDEDERPAPISQPATVVKAAATAVPTAIPTAIPTLVPTKQVQAKNTATAVHTAVVVKPEATATAAVSSQQQDEIKMKVDYMKSAIESALAANSDLAASLREMQSDIRRIEERSLEIKGMAQDMSEYKERLGELEDKYSKDKEVIGRAIGDMDKMKDNMKASVDKIQGWDDIMDVMKKGTSNNELEIAKLKKIINDLKLKYGENDGNFLTEISKWPYTGFVTLLLSIIALSVAVAK